MCRIAARPSALHDLIAGNIDVLIDAAVVPHVKSGKLRGLAVAGEQRIAELPDLPTLAEAGFPGLRTSGWQGLFGPALLPPDVIGFYTHHLSQLYADESFSQAADRGERLAGLSRPGGVRQAGLRTTMPILAGSSAMPRSSGRTDLRAVSGLGRFSLTARLVLSAARLTQKSDG